MDVTEGSAKLFGGELRENAFQNTALKHTMKGWLHVNQHTVIKFTSPKNHEEREHVVAQHAAGCLNDVLDEHPRFKEAPACAASSPMKGVMRIYLKKHLGME